MSIEKLDPAFVLSDDQLTTVLEKELDGLVDDFLLVEKSGNAGSSLPYDWSKAKAYYQQYRAQGNDCSSNEFNLDCTHFVCHGLDQTKIVVNNPQASCNNGLSIRVAELAAAFNNAAAKYSNVKKISRLSDTREVIIASL